MKKNKLLALVLSLILCAGLCVPALAAGVTVTTEADKTSLTASAEEQTVVATITFSEAIQVTAYSAEVSIPEGWSTAAGKVKANINNAAGTGEPGQIAGGYANGKIAKTFGMEYGVNEDAFAQLTGFTITYTVPADAAAGAQTIGLTKLVVTKQDGTAELNGVTATASVTITAAAPAEGYGVALSSNVTEIAKDGAINLYLDVTHASETAFNAFYAVLTYDSAKVSYSGEATVSGFTVDSSTAETLKLSKTGANVAIGDSHELTLPFTANAAGSASFELTSAKVDKAANAETQNAPDATISGSLLAVTVTETYTYSVNVTLGANMTSSGGNVSQTGLTGAMTDVVVTPATGYALAAPTVSPADVGIIATLDSTTGAYTISGTPTADVTVTFTAATVKAPVVTTSTYFGSYTLIAATIEADGYVPTYDSNVMFKVSGTGYDADTYYYVAAGDYDATKLGSAAGTATTVTKSADVNQTGVVDINDAQFVYNIYNGAAPTSNIVQRLLLADVNGDKTVNVSDCAAVVAAIG